jgi:hypothetical protein
MEPTTPYERSMDFLMSSGDNLTKLKTLLFIRGELNRVQETPETIYLKEIISGLVDVMCVD